MKFPELPIKKLQIVKSYQKNLPILTKPSDPTPLKDFTTIIIHVQEHLPLNQL